MFEISTEAKEIATTKEKQSKTFKTEKGTFRITKERTEEREIESKPKAESESESESEQIASVNQVSSICKRCGNIISDDRWIKPTRQERRRVARKINQKYKPDQVHNYPITADRVIERAQCDNCHNTVYNVSKGN